MTRYKIIDVYSQCTYTDTLIEHTHVCKYIYVRRYALTLAEVKLYWHDPVGTSELVLY